MPDTAEQYRSGLYAKVQDQESRAMWGMNIDELHETETDFALDVTGIDTWQASDRILDLASGRGGHARNLQLRTGAHVDAFDLSQNLVEIGHRELEGASEDLRGKLHLAVGNMVNLEGVPDQNYRLISILGQSFIYFDKPEEIDEALNNYHDRLENGGRLVIQFRSQAPDDWNKGDSGEDRTDNNVEVFEEDQTTAERNGRISSPPQGIWGVRDKKTGEYHYAYRTAIEVPQGIPEDRIRRREDGEIFGYYDADGVEHFNMERVYGDSNEETNLGTANITEFTQLKTAPILQRKMEAAGFRNVRIQKKYLSNNTVMFCLVGEK